MVTRDAGRCPRVLMLAPPVSTQTLAVCAALRPSWRRLLTAWVVTGGQLAWGSGTGEDRAKRVLTRLGQLVKVARGAASPAPKVVLVHTAHDGGA